jgi:VIT1/CCC1 family predicted Fe2+/Mn2+ transporter
MKFQLGLALAALGIVTGIDAVVSKKPVFTSFFELVSAAHNAAISFKAVGSV